MAAPKPFQCPICHAPWRSSTNLCAACGADLLDPDVKAMADATAGQPGASQSMPGIASGSLTVGRFLGVSRENVADGSVHRRYALYGGIALVLAFLAPALRTVKRQLQGYDPSGEPIVKKLSQFHMSWSDAVWKDPEGSKLALLFPLLAGLVGLAVALAPRLQATVRAKALALVGLVGLVVCVGKLGRYGGAPETLLHLGTLGLLVAGVGMLGRMLDPQSQPARWALAAGAGLVVLGYLIPWPSDLAARFPVELQFRPTQLEIDLDGNLPVAALAAGMKKISSGGKTGFVPEVLFVSLVFLLPLVAVPAAAALAWKRQQGVWDKAGYGLRPLAWFVVLFLPLAYAFLAFNATGWHDEGSATALYGRARLFFIVTPLALWAQVGLYAAILPYAEARAARRAEPEPATPSAKVA